MVIVKIVFVLDRMLNQLIHIVVFFTIYFWFTSVLQFLVTSICCLKCKYLYID